MIKVYRYGLRPPTENEALVREQMHLAHKYRNVLTEIERGRRAAIRDLVDGREEISSLLRSAREADERARIASLALSAVRTESRSRSGAETEVAALTQARTLRNEALRALDSARRAAQKTPEIVAAVDRIAALRLEIFHSARAHSGLFWGTYQLVEDAMTAASKMPLWDGVEGSDPRFSRWDGSAEVGVQITNGMDATKAFGDDTRVRIGPVDPRAWERCEGYRQLSRTTLSMRVKSDGQRPVWAQWPLIMHRGFPEGARIKRAAVHVRKIGPHEEWWVTFTVDMPEIPARNTELGSVAIDLGWRQIGNELRVASWCASSGETGELRLDGRTLGALEKPSGLRATRDGNFNLAREALKRALAIIPELPEWIVKRTATMSLWHSCDRLASLAVEWRTNRFYGDDAAFAGVEAWRKQDKHLWCWEANGRDQALRRRKDMYRVFAARLAAAHGTLALEQFDLRTIARKPAPTDAENTNETARGNRQFAAVSELQLILEQAFESRGGKIIYVDPNGTTRECHACLAVNDFDAAGQLSHTCFSCGTRWDQDENAARNILRRSLDSRFIGARKARKTKVSADPSETRWIRAKRLREEKEARKEVLANLPISVEK